MFFWCTKRQIIKINITKKIIKIITKLWNNISQTQIVKQYFANTNCETIYPRQHIFILKLFCLMLNNVKLENIFLSPTKSIAKLYAYIMLKYWWENWQKSIKHVCIFIRPKSDPCHLPLSVVSNSFTRWLTDAFGTWLIRLWQMVSWA